MPTPSTPIPNIPKTAPREFSNLRSPKDAGSPFTQWKNQQAYAAQINSLTEFCKVIWGEVSKLKATKTDGLTMYPFKIYNIPSIYRTSSSLNDWRTFNIRNGYVLTKYVSTGSLSSVWGTDGVPYPDQAYYPQPIGKGDIVVPENEGQYWFWIEELMPPDPVSGSYIIRHGNDPKTISSGNPQPWENFPSSSEKHTMIGYVDTKTSASIYYPYVRQMLRTDVISTGNVSQSFAEMYVCGEDQVVEKWFVHGYRSGSV